MFLTYKKTINTSPHTLTASQETKLQVMALFTLICREREAKEYLRKTLHPVKRWFDDWPAEDVINSAGLRCKDVGSPNIFTDPLLVLAMKKVLCEVWKNSPTLTRDILQVLSFYLCIVCIVC